MPKLVPFSFNVLQHDAVVGVLECVRVNENRYEAVKAVLKQCRGTAHTSTLADRLRSDSIVFSFNGDQVYGIII